jgi:hypothetical protein
MIPYAEWLDAAKELPLGRSKRIKHCNSNYTMKINHDEKGYSAYCFRCSDGGSKAHGVRRIRDLFAEREFQYAKDIILPDDYTMDIPPDQAVWLYRAGISKALAESYYIGYSPKLHRVILPVYAAGKLVVTQGRAVDSWLKPKYLNQAGNNKSSYLFESHSCTGAWNRVVITEDILSCIRVGEVCPAVCCMGTALSDAQAGRLLQWDEVFIWLDNDAAGWKGAVSMRKKLEPVCNVRIISSIADPRCYDNQAIERILNG